MWSGGKGQLDYVSADRGDRRYARHLGYRRYCKLYGHHYGYVVTRPQQTAAVIDQAAMLINGGSRCRQWLA